MMTGPAENPMTCILIPGIGTSYLKAIPLLARNRLFWENCEKAHLTSYVESLDPGAEDDRDAIMDTIQNQQLSYVINCTMCDLYTSRGLDAEMVIGYSMGIYAALYHGGFYSFDEGLFILEKAYALVSKHCAASGKSYGMCLLLGLTHREIEEEILRESEDRVEIAMHNGKRNFVLAGENPQLQGCAKKALRLGAIGTRTIYTEHPYHSSHLLPIDPEFRAFVEHCSLLEPRRAVLSLIDGEKIPPEKAAEVIVQSMYTPLHFDLALDNAVRLYGASTWYETGPPKSISRLANYINKKLIVRPFTEED